MSEVRRSATAYLNGTHKKEKINNSLAAKLARFSDPFISSNGELCVNMRSYERSKKIHGRHIKMPGLILNLETKDDIHAVIQHLNDLLEHEDLLRAVAEKRRERYMEYKR